MIEMYSQRNETLHSDFEGMIRARKWMSLAQRLARDRCELEAVFPPTAIDHLYIVSKVIDTKITLLFTRDENHPDEFEAWTRTPYSQELSLKAKEKGNLTKNLSARTLELTLKGLRAEARKRADITGLPLPVLDAGLPKVKRVASASWDAENEELTRRKQALDICAKAVARARQVSDDYIQDYGALDPPPQLVRDDSLDAGPSSGAE